MRTLNIVVIILVFIFGIYQMRNASSVLNTDWFKNLNYNDKLKTTSIVKGNWKISIILLSIVVCEMLILISSFIGKTHYYENIINISVLIISIIVTISLIINNQKLNKDLKKQHLLIGEIYERKNVKNFRI